MRPSHQQAQRPFRKTVRATLQGRSVRGTRAGGFDRAYFTDSPQVDLLEAQDNRAKLSNAVIDFLYQATDFDYVKATATTPGDTKSVLPHTFQLDLVGPWQDL